MIASLILKLLQLDSVVFVSHHFQLCITYFEERYISIDNKGTNMLNGDFKTAVHVASDGLLVAKNFSLKNPGAILWTRVKIFDSLNHPQCNTTIIFTVKRVSFKLFVQNKTAFNFKFNSINILSIILSKEYSLNQNDASRSILLDSRRWVNINT